METEKMKFGTTRVAILAVIVVTTIAVGSVVAAQESPAKPAVPPNMDKMGMDAGASGMMGMGADGKGMTGKMSSMEKMKCCGQGMSHSDRGASDQQDEKKK